MKSERKGTEREQQIIEALSEEFDDFEFLPENGNPIRSEDTSDMMHNNNCHEYLSHLNAKWEEIGSAITLRFPDHEFVQYLNNFFSQFKARLQYKGYLAEFAYGDLYTTFHQGLEEPSLRLYHQCFESKNIIDASSIQLFRSLTPFIRLLYANPNSSLVNAGNILEKVLGHLKEQKQPASYDTVEKHVEHTLTNPNESLNDITPISQEQPLTRLKNNVGINVKLQTTTSIPSVRTYKYKDNAPGLCKEYRFGTQVQVHNGNNRIYPTFHLWLQSLSNTTTFGSEQENVDKIDHVYFNYLSTEKPALSVELLNREYGWSEMLYDLENEHKNILVVTLPANNSLLRLSMLNNQTKQFTIEDATTLFTAILTNKNLDDMKRKFPSLKTCLNDDINFHMSPRAKALVYKAEPNELEAKEEQEIKKLIIESIKKLGFENRKQLSPAELQALYFHLTKFELPKYILDAIQPQSFNMTCKDAIDRGGISSAYYNLMLSLELNEKEPLSEVEFNRSLHAAAMVVKGRAVKKEEFHRLWNAIGYYIKAGNDVPGWLVEWHKTNTLNNTYFEALLLCEQTINDNIVLTETNESTLSTIIKLDVMIKLYRNDEYADTPVLLPTTMQRTLLSEPLLSVYNKINSINGVLPPELKNLQQVRIRMDSFANQLTQLKTYWENALDCVIPYGIIFDEEKKKRKKSAAGKLLTYHNSLASVLGQDIGLTKEEEAVVLEIDSRLLDHYKLLQQYKPRNLAEYIDFQLSRRQDDNKKTDWTIILESEFTNPLTDKPFDKTADLFKIISPPKVDDKANDKAEDKADDGVLFQELINYYNNPQNIDFVILDKLYNCFLAYAILVSDFDASQLPKKRFASEALNSVVILQEGDKIEEQQAGDKKEDQEEEDKKEVQETRANKKQQGVKEQTQAADSTFDLVLSKMNSKRLPQTVDQIEIKRTISTLALIKEHGLNKDTNLTKQDIVTSANDIIAHIEEPNNKSKKEKYIQAVKQIDDSFLARLNEMLDKEVVAKAYEPEGANQERIVEEQQMLETLKKDVLENIATIKASGLVSNELISTKELMDLSIAMINLLKKPKSTNRFTDVNMKLNNVVSKYKYYKVIQEFEALQKDDTNDDTSIKDLKEGARGLVAEIKTLKENKKSTLKLDDLVIIADKAKEIFTATCAYKTELDTASQFLKSGDQPKKKSTIIGDVTVHQKANQFKELTDTYRFNPEANSLVKAMEAFMRSVLSILPISESKKGWFDFYRPSLTTAMQTLSHKASNIVGPQSWQS